MTNISIIQHNNINKISINGKMYNPTAYKTFRAEAKYIKQVYDSGVRLFDVVIGGKTSAIGVEYSLFGETWIGNNEYDFKPLDNQIDLFIENAPEAYFAPMIQLDTRDWWLEENKNVADTFKYLSQTCSNQKWREDASAYLQAMIRHIEEKYGDRIFGYFLLCGHTTEWFSEYDYESESEDKIKAFKDYIGDQSAIIPKKEERELEHEKVFLDLNKNKNLINYRKFHSHLISDTILYFAQKAQEIIKHRKLLGIYFGYMLGVVGARLFNVGHLDYERVFASKDLDMFSAPTCYLLRNEDDTAAFMLTVSSLNKHGKIFFQEYDLRSGHMKVFTDNKFLMQGSMIKNDETFCDLMRRELMLTNANGCGLWWFDMFAGWYDSDIIQDTIKQINNISEILEKLDCSSNAEIAVIADPTSLYYVNKNSGINITLLSYMRVELANMGAPYDLFSAMDIFDVDFSKYKVVIFLNQFYADNKLRVFINEHLKKDGKAIIWSYGAGYFNENKKSIENIFDLTDIKVCEDFGNSYVKIDSLHCDYYTEYCRESTLYIQDDKVQPLSFHNESGNISIAIKQLSDYTSVVSTIEQPIDAGILRRVIKNAGVHVYAKDAMTSVYVNKSTIGVYHKRKQDAIINVEENGTYIDLFSGTQYVTKNKEIFIPYNDKRCKLLLLQDCGDEID